jgi:hypothetical protein
MWRPPDIMWRPPDNYVAAARYYVAAARKLSGGRQIKYFSYVAPTGFRKKRQLESKINRVSR